MRTTSLTLCLLLAALTGCSANQVITPVAAGGSAADGIVVMAYEYRDFTNFTVDLDAAQETAEARCKGWGFYEAEPFDGESRVCQDDSGFGCSQWIVKRQYQCRYTE